MVSDALNVIKTWESSEEKLFTQNETEMLSFNGKSNKKQKELAHPVGLTQESSHSVWKVKLHIPYFHITLSVKSIYS